MLLLLQNLDSLLYITKLCKRLLTNNKTQKRLRICHSSHCTKRFYKNEWEITKGGKNACEFLVFQRLANQTRVIHLSEPIRFEKSCLRFT